MNEQNNENWFRPFKWRLAHGRSLTLGPKGHLMGILNVTPDSFSDGGVFSGVDAAVERGLEMAAAGASIIDIGGESTKPGASTVDAATEQARLLPVIEALAQNESLLISADTYRTETARLALDAGAHIINDVWGFQKEPELAAVVHEFAAGCCLMHSGRERVRDKNPIRDHHAFLSRSLDIADNAGINRAQIVLDPGFGFAKNPDENLRLLAELEMLHAHDLPLLIGTSRKRFLGAITGQEAGDRDNATAAATVIARLKGGAIFRVHDIEKNRDALAVADAVLSSQSGDQYL